MKRLTITLLTLLMLSVNAWGETPPEQVSTSFDLFCNETEKVLKNKPLSLRFSEVIQNNAFVLEAKFLYFLE